MSRLVVTASEAHHRRHSLLADDRLLRNKSSPTIDKQIYVDGFVVESVIQDTFLSFFEATSSRFPKNEGKILKSQYDILGIDYNGHERENNKVDAELIGSILETK